MIKPADKNQLEQLKHVWHVCFGDNFKEIDFFFTEFFANLHTIVYNKNCSAVAMINILPAKIIIKNRSIKAGYIYAAATLPEHRSCGIMADMLEYTKDYAKKINIDALFLVPANDNLFKYYNNHGYNNFFYCKKTVLTKNQLKSLKNRDENAKILPNDMIFEIRKKYLNKKSYVSWDEKYINYAITSNNNYGGKSIALKVLGEYAYMMYNKHKNQLIVKEMFCSKDNFPVLCNALLKNEPECEKFIFRTISDFAPFLNNGKIISFGMMLKINDDLNLGFENHENYLGLALD